jgi:hypothetical protein
VIIIHDPSAVASESYPLTHARIGYDRLDGTPTASTAANGSPALGAYTVNTYEHWQPTALPAWWKVSAQEPTLVNYCGIAVHQLIGEAVQVQYSANDSDWTSILAAPALITNGDPILILFPEVSARYWRIAIEGSELPAIAHIRFGYALTMMRPIFAGHNPGPLNRETAINPNVSERGQFLGRSIIRSGVREAFAWQHLDPDWYRENFDPFVLDARENPFFIAWRPNPDSPSENDVIYGWVNDDMAPTNMGIRDLMSVSMEVAGISNGD